MIKTTTTLLADAIRREDSGKAIIIGVYGDNVALKRFPSNLVMAMWIEIEVSKIDPSEEFDLELRVVVSDMDGTQKHEAAQAFAILFDQSGELATASDSRFKTTLMVNGVPVTITEEGSLDVSIRQKGGRWKKIMSKLITRAND